MIDDGSGVGGIGDGAENDNGISGATLRLNKAREHAKQSRMGAGNPRSVLLALMSEISAASASFDSFQEHSDPLSKAELVSELVHANSQYLRLSEHLDLLPKNQSEDFDEIESQTIRGRCVEISGIALKTVNWNDISPWAEIELYALHLGAKLEFARRLDAHRRDHALQLVAAEARELLNRAATCSAPDERRTGSWALIECVRILEYSETDPPERQLLMTHVEPGMLNEPWIEFCYALTRLSADLEPKQVPNELENLKSRFLKVSIDKHSNLGARAMLATPMMTCAARQADNDNVDEARSIIDAYLELQGYATTGRPQSTARLFAAEGKLYCILTDGSDSELFRQDLPEDELLAFAEASRTASTDDIPRLRKRISNALRPTIQALAKASNERLYLAPIGICSWVPWHALSTGYGGSLAALRRVSWLSASTNTAMPAGLSADGDALIIDMSFRESKELIRRWEESGFDEQDIVRFSSTSDDGLSLDDFSRVLETHNRVVFFGHSASDPLDANESCIVLGRDTAVRAADLGRLAFPGLSQLVLVSCEGGRDGIFLSGESPAVWFSKCGIDTIIGSLWTITAKDGASYLSEVLQLLSQGKNLVAAWDEIAAKQTTPARMPFCCFC